MTFGFFRLVTYRNRVVYITFWYRTTRVYALLCSLYESFFVKKTGGALSLYTFAQAMIITQTIFGLEF